MYKNLGYSFGGENPYMALCHYLAGRDNESCPGQITFSARKLHISYTKSAIDSFAHYIDKNSMDIYVHSPFTINLSDPFTKYSPNSDKWVIDGIRKHLKLCESMHTKGLVFHVGKHKNIKSVQEATDMMENSIRKVIDSATEMTPFILETPVGCGTEILTTFEEFGNFYEKFEKDERFKVCIDTCHVFACGHDPLGYITRWIDTYGSDSLALIHFNDSKKPQGSKVDRHERPGLGHIGENVLSKIADVAYTNGIPIVME